MLELEHYNNEFYNGQETEEVYSVGKWFGIQFLTGIPIVGLILLIVWICSGNPTLKTYAKAKLIAGLIVTTVVISLTAFGVFREIAEMAIESGQFV